ncbi:MAG: serine/threonine protein kinase [Gammaproteobacteria bacterium]|nr:serine/threonine protein kinase [Gammaproteobacteria bacterium]
MEIPGYRIQRLIGKGGMATVYMAIQESLHRPVVLKILDQVSAHRTEDLIERFIAEGRIIASLRHPNIITIYDIGLADTSLFISMEYVQGGDLKQRMELPISVDETLDYLGKIAGALAEAHKHGVVHRDVKPANILFRDDHTPLLTDFGIAKQVDTESDLTSTGIFLGSPNYVSPEQADGIKTDGRADIYSLGCILYEMLTGKKPFQSNSVIDVVIQHKQAPIPRLPPEAADLQPLLDRMMAKRREDRYSDAESVIQTINKIRDARRRAQHLSVSGKFEISPVSGADRERRAKQVLGALVLLGMVMFSSLKYVEVRLKAPAAGTANVSAQAVLSSAQELAPPVLQAEAPATAAAAPDDTVVQQGSGPAGNPPPAAETGPAPPAAGGVPEVSEGSPATASEPAPPAPPPEQVVQALVWLGRRSLEEYKLTYPPKDNAYYYFNRLLEMDPGNQTAVAGILEIADRYAMLAEQSLARNEMDKSAAYADIGLRINPDNEALRALKNLGPAADASFIGKVKRLFSSR